MTDTSEIHVEVVFATPTRQALVDLVLDTGATVADAIDAALPSRFPDEPLGALQAGIWGRPVERTRRLRDGDRVELYRPLEKDPRETRRELAAAAEASGRPKRGPS